MNPPKRNNEVESLNDESSKKAYAFLLDDYNRHISFERGLSKNTRLNYIGDLKYFLNHCQAVNTPPENADKSFIDSFLWKAKNDKNLSPASMFRKIESLKSFYRFLLIENKIKDTPTSHLKSPTLIKKIPRYLTQSEIDKLLSYPAKDFPMIRTLTIIELFYASGIRISELLNLTLEQVNLEQDWVIVYGKGGKERIVPINPVAHNSIEKYLQLRQLTFAKKGADSEIFVNRSGKKISRVQVWKDIVKLGKLAGVDRKLHPHLFRHTFASHLLIAGADLRSLQEMLGHASLSTTQRYTHLDKADIKNIHSKYHPKG
jgi:integrase/recombinase XerD